MSDAPKLKNVMTPFPYSVDAEAPIDAAVEFMRKHKIRHLPVTTKGALSSVVTDRDIKRALPSPLTGQLASEEYDAVLDETKLAKVMTRDPQSVSPDAPLADAVKLMFEKKIGGLPVVENGKLVGIFTQTDALKLCLDLLAKAG